MKTPSGRDLDLPSSPILVACLPVLREPLLGHRYVRAIGTLIAADAAFNMRCADAKPRLLPDGSMGGGAGRGAEIVAALEPGEEIIARVKELMEVLRPPHEYQAAVEAELDQLSGRLDQLVPDRP